MPKDSDFVAYVLDCMAQAGLGPVQRERLFSGHGLRVDGEMFAVILRDTLYFVVDDQSRPRFEAAGMGPFTYTRKAGTRQVPRWYELPEDVLLDADELRDWMREALAAVRRSPRPSSQKKKAAAKIAAPVKKVPVKKVGKAKTVKPKARKSGRAAVRR